MTENKIEFHTTSDFCMCSHFSQRSGIKITSKENDCLHSIFSDAQRGNVSQKFLWKYICNWNCRLRSAQCLIYTPAIHVHQLYVKWIQTPLPAMLMLLREDQIPAILKLTKDQTYIQKNTDRVIQGNLINLIWVLLSRWNPFSFDFFFWPPFRRGKMKFWFWMKLSSPNLLL